MKSNILKYTLVVCLLLSNEVLAQNTLPSREQRIYSLSDIWKELHYNFAFPHKLQEVNIDSLYIAYLPKVAEVESTYEYYRILSSFMANFNEAHTRIYTSKRPDDMPPIKAINFGEKIIVSDISQNIVDQIPVNSEILKINDIPVLAYIKDSVSPFISAATPHWKFDKSVIELFYGKPQSKVNLTVKKPNGHLVKVSMVRNYYTNNAKEVMVVNKNLSPINIEIIDGDIGYIQLSSFLGGYVDSINSVFESNLPKLRRCKGLVIDLRGNRGGSDQAWERIAYHLISQSEFDLPVKYFSRMHIASYKNWGSNSTNPQLKEYYRGTVMEEINHSLYVNTIDDTLKLHQPLVIISGQHVASAAEDFLLLMKGLGRAKVIGEPSVGCVGEPMFVPLPGDFEVMICVKKYVNSDGTQPNDTGIMPDIKVIRDYDEYLKGSDNVLESSVAELKKLIYRL